MTGLFDNWTTEQLHNMLAEVRTHYAMLDLDSDPEDYAQVAAELRALNEEVKRRERLQHFSGNSK